MPGFMFHARCRRRRVGLATLAIALVSAHAGAESGLNVIADDAAHLGPLRALVVARDGVTVVERGYRGHAPDSTANIKSASKAIVSTLVGIAIQRGLIEGIDQPIAPLLRDAVPPDADPRLADVTIGHLLSAILTRSSGHSTLALARDWLGGVDGFRIGHWQRDPQGIYFGGNQMAMSTRSLLAFGELYRRGGLSQDGRRIVPAEWIDSAWAPRTQSRFTGDDYGFGWFLRCLGGYQAAYAWGYGGQMLYVVPEAGLTIAMTSDDSAPAGRTGYRDELHRLTTDIIVAATAESPRPEVAETPVTVRLNEAARCWPPASFEHSPSGSNAPAGRR